MTREDVTKKREEKRASDEEAQKVVWWAGRGQGMRDGRCRDEAGQRLSNGSKQVPGPLLTSIPRWVENELQYAAEDSWVLVTGVRGEAAR